MLSEADWDLTLDVNLKGAFLCCQAAAPALTASGRGRIVTISLDAGHRGFPSLHADRASKFGLIGLTESLAGELAPKVTVNSVCPVGVASTGMGQHVLSWKVGTGRTPDEILAGVARGLPLGRGATETDIADAVLFFISEAASFITGVALDVDGGSTLRRAAGCPDVSRLPFTDTHVHFHDMRERKLRYSWLMPGGVEEEAAVLGDYAAIRSERYWADDFLAETRFQGVERIVHVQAALGIDDPVEETRWLQAFADRLGVPHGVIGSANLAAPNFREVLARHLESPIFRGIRNMVYEYDGISPTGTGSRVSPCWASTRWSIARLRHSSSFQPLQKSRRAILTRRSASIMR